MDKRVTIYDLAKTLGVSSGPVSRSLNNHISISEKTKKRVITKVNELGYKTIKFVGNLTKQRFITSTVIVPKLNAIFTPSLPAGTETIANQTGYKLIGGLSLEAMDKEKLNARASFDSGVDDHLASLAYNTSDFDYFTNYIKNKISLIFIDKVHHLPNCYTIFIDNQLAGFKATEHLITRGCKNLLIMSGNLKRNVYTHRLKGFKEAMNKRYLKFDNSKLPESDLGINSVKKTIAHIKSSSPPSLSTINYSGYDMDILAGQSVIIPLNGTIDHQPANSITFKHHLIARESTLK